jgi:long-subunit fatty acid transport protein
VINSLAFLYFYTINFTFTFMRRQNQLKLLKSIFFVAFFVFTINSFAQDSTAVEKPETPGSQFWKKVRIGGGLGLNFGNNVTTVSIAPSAVYEFNKYFSGGVGVQGTYVSFRGAYKSYIYGGSLIGLVNPIRSLQLSAELEQLRVNTRFDPRFATPLAKDWNTALFLGVGYVTSFSTIGIRYNVLYKETDNVYGQAFLPFVRIFF